MRLARSTPHRISSRVTSLIAASLGFLCLISPVRPAEAGPSQETSAEQRIRAASPAGLVVRGSVEQIHVINAVPHAKVTVDGPSGYQAIATTDEFGGLIFRNVPAGESYRVAIEGSNVEQQAVRVLSRDQHPDRSFYSSQKIEPTDGYIKTRDGTLLSYRVVLPDAAVHGSGPYGLIITYSGYQPGLKTNDRHQNIPFEKFSERGYAVAGVNMRGSGCSGGAFDLMEPVTCLDGYDVVEAFAAQAWVDGVALGDQSWPGLTQLYVASTRPPSLDAIIAGSVVGDFYRDVFYPGGIQNIGFGHIWAAGRDVENTFPTRRKEVNFRIETDPICAANQSLRGQNVSLLETIRQHPYDDSFWQGRSAEALVAKINVPTLQVVSWQDPQVGSRPAILADRFADSTPFRLVGVNGFHQYWSGAVWDEVTEFLDTYMGGASETDIQAYEAQNAFVVLLESNDAGEVRGRFTLPRFAAAGEGRRFNLGSDLSPDKPNESGHSSSFTYDPTSPGSWGAPAQDQVSFTSKELPADTVLAGSGSVDLWIAADAEDVDLQVTLSELRPDGKEMLVQSGWLRASHRALDEGASIPLRPRHLHTAVSVAKLTPGERTPLRVELFPFAHVFRKSSKLRLSISGPGGAVNAWPWALDSLPGGFRVRIIHDQDIHPSSVVLPVVNPVDLTLPAALPHCDKVTLQPCRPINQRGE